MKNIYITITIMNFDSNEKLIYDGDFNPDMNPFEVGGIVKLEKEHEQSENLEAIRAKIPYTGKIGYVANNNNRKIKGTMSAERVYDIIKDISYARIIFITDKEIIAELLDSKKSKDEIEAIELLFKKYDENKDQLKDSKKSKKPGTIVEIEPDRSDDLFEDPILVKDLILDDMDEFSESDLINPDIKINSMLKNKLATLTIEKFLKSKGLQPVDFEIFPVKEDDNSFEVHVVSKMKEDLETNNEHRINHDEIAILAYKKEELIDKYFEIKEKILELNSLIEYKIKKNKTEFYQDFHFLTMTIEKDYVLITIKSNKQLNLEDKFIEYNEDIQNENNSKDNSEDNFKNNSKNIHQYKIIIKEDENIDNLIELIKEVLDLTTPAEAK
jgi:hypothetical protein